jgi:predicted TIM-barrel fold metal-dependent hydrolase
MDEKKLLHALMSVEDLDLFLLFAIIDACTPSKGRQMIRWFVEEVAKRFPNLTTVRPEHILSGPEEIEGAW